MLNRAFKYDLKQTDDHTQSTAHSESVYSASDTRQTQVGGREDSFLRRGEMKIYQQTKDTDKVNENKTVNGVSSCDGDDGLVCGVGPFHPACLQKCTTIGYFTAASSVTGIITSALSSYINSQITTLEKHFNFSSSVSGFLMSCNDLGYLLVALVMSYCTRRVHIPRALGVATFLYGVSGLACTVAYFGTRDQLTNPTATETVEGSEKRYFAQMCENVTSTSSGNATCEELSERTLRAADVTPMWRTVALVILGAGMMLQGMAKSPRSPFTGTYVDDNVPKSKTSTYLGIITGFAIFGPSLAFLCGGLFSKVYVTLEDTDMSFKDPRWIGAWWLGFLVFGLAGLIVAVPMCCFPRHLKGRRQVDGGGAEKAAAQPGHGGKKTKAVAKETRGFVLSVRRLLTNPVFVLIILSNSFNLMAISGFYAFLPKYLETQFTLPVWQTNITLGAGTAISTFLGTIVGGYLTTRFKLTPLACLRVVFTGLALSTPIWCMGFVLGCDQPVIQMGLPGDSDNSSSQCVADCHCDNPNFFPVCGADNRNYFSPCHAGCTSIRGSHTFLECSCVTGTNTTRPDQGPAASAVAGFCDSECTYFYPYVFSLFTMAFIGTLTVMPNFVACVRSVLEADKPLALGLQSFCGTALGWFPGPVIFGRLVDTTCLVWQTNCDSAGACSLYDLNDFRIRFHGLVVLLRVISISLIGAALLYATYSKTFKFQSQTEEINVTSNPNDDKSVKYESSDSTVEIVPTGK